MPRTTPPKSKPLISQKSLIRAVASSTAIETGQSIQALEKQLKLKSQRFAHIKLAR